MKGLEPGVILEHKETGCKVVLIKRFALEEGKEIGWLVKESGARWCLLDAWLQHWIVIGKVERELAEVR